MTVPAVAKAVSKSERVASTLSVPVKPIASNVLASTKLAKTQKPTVATVPSPAPTAPPKIIAVPAQPILAAPSIKPPEVVVPPPKATTSPTVIVTPVLRKPATPTAPNVPPPPVQSSSVSTTVKTKAKKKKSQPTVTMATAATAQGAGGTQGENTGRWTAEEHRLFLQGLEEHGKGWKKIASLIKSRTVVQIRTHAQKYFQKLAKARQNGEEGDVSMDARGGSTSVALGGIPVSTSASGKRRRQTTGTKRKAISSVVTSVTREAKRQAQQPAASVPPPQQLPAVAPALAPFLMPQPSGTTTPTTLPSSAHSAITGPALEDSLFRFLTPAPVAPNEQVQVNDVARQAGANPITVPTDNPSAAPSISGEVSPTCVTDVAIFPSWTDAKDMPSWYAKGADVDVLLDAADGLDWLTDTGDLHETYEPPPGNIPAATKPRDLIPTDKADGNEFMKANSATNLTTEALSGDSAVEVPPLPSLFESSDPDPKKQKPVLSASSTGIDESLDVFDTPMEEHAFVSALLENNGESSNSLPNLQ